jgi:tellurite methyltransferase
MSGEREIGNLSVAFFDRQFARQSEAGDYALNPFETAVLPYLFGDVLDLGCGLGNLALSAARRGCRVTALDASPTAVHDLKRRADQAGLALTVEQADLRHYVFTRDYDCVVSIGLFMFFPPEQARASLAALPHHIRPGGVAAVNVLIEGTTFMDMFDPQGYYLFRAGELQAAFPGWTLEFEAIDAFPAPGGTLKRFETVVMRRPA